jgi:transcription antitermination protein NusB
MSNRHLARTMAMQCLFEWDFRDQDVSRLPAIISHVKDDFAPSFEEGGYIESQVQNVVASQKDIDALLVRFAPEWPLVDMTATDRNILRLGIYELKFDEAIPAKVAINEAIELGKAFGGEASGKFINGVLGAVYKDMVANGEMKKVDLDKKLEDVPSESGVSRVSGEVASDEDSSGGDDNDEK